MSSFMSSFMRGAVTRTQSVAESLVVTTAAFLFVDVPTAFFVMLGLGGLHDQYHAVPAMGFVYVLLSLVLLSLVYHGCTYKIDQ